MKILNTFLNGYFKQKTAETGRSMVEILGVLAVIGVLSIGGIYGYTFAMDKYRANDIIYEVNLRNRDTWNKYQDKDLPEAEELDEWADTTQTGFPIGVYPRSNIVFDVQVDDVPSRVCKQVLNMNIEGPMFIWTPSEDGKKQIFNGNASELCGDDIETSIVFTTSLDSYGQDEGLRQGATDENGRPIRYCTEDSDCMEKCETCGLSYTCESNCPSDKPICSTNEYKTCVTCESNSDCPKNQICDESTGENKCVEVPESCPSGTFRSKNGACIECKYGGNIVVSEEAFDAVGIRDSKTGIEMCQACGETGNARILENVTHEDGSKTYYCSATCTKGISVQTVDKGCVSCGDFPQYEDYKIINDAQAKAQCEACGLVYRPRASLCGHDSCPMGQWKVWYTGSCMSCTATIEYVYTDNHRRMCTENCPGLRKLVDDKCERICQQPTNMSDEESTRICQEEGPTSPNCKRTFAGYWNGKTCFSCNYAQDVTFDGVIKEDEELCRKCGRYMDKNKKTCFLNPLPVCTNKKDENGNNSQENQFPGYDGKCYPCAKVGLVHIEDTEEARNACINNCAGVQVTKNGVTSKGRKVYLRTDGFVACGLDCPSDSYWYQSEECIKCDDYTNSKTYFNQLGWEALAGSEARKRCEACPNRKMFHVGRQYCVVENCPSGYIHGSAGHCVSCQDPANAITMFGIPSEQMATECQACGNRFAVGDKCMKYIPGQNGVCNSYDNGTLSPYPAGDGQLLRDVNGTCQNCHDKNAIYTMNPVDKVTQCRSCGNRRVVGDTCVYGLCEQESTFMNIRNECPSCSADTQQIPDTTVSRDMCQGCSRPLMTIQLSETQTALYCAKEECSEGSTYHTQTDKMCKSCSEGNIAVIGNEGVYSGYCESCNRVAFEENGIKKCSQQATDGYFINISGNKVSCSAGKTQIYNSAKAKEICRACTSSEREVTTDLDGNFYCEKVL